MKIDRVTLGADANGICLVSGPDISQTVYVWFLGQIYHKRYMSRFWARYITNGICLVSGPDTLYNIYVLKSQTYTAASASAVADLLFIRRLSLFLGQCTEESS